MNYRIFLIITLVINTISISGQAVSEKRTFEKSFPVMPKLEVQIVNKYGTVHVAHAKADTITIRVEVEAMASSSARLRKMMDGVEINLTGSPMSVRGTTTFGKSITDMVETFKGITGSLIPYESKITINYYITIPAGVGLVIENRYGDIIIDDQAAPLELTISNGTLKTGKLGESTKLSVYFCNADIEGIKGGSLDLNYSDLTIGSSGDLTVLSRSSKIDIDITGILKIDSRRDKWFIDDLVQIRGTSYFSDFSINSLSSGAILDMKYGTLNADITSSSFSALEITSFNTFSYISLPKSSSFNLDARRINADITLPSENSNIEEKTISDEKKEYLLYGTIGTKKTDQVVKLDIDRGSFRLKYK